MTRGAITMWSATGVEVTNVITSHSAMWRSRRALFVGLLLVGCLLRLGYGVARHHDAFALTGRDFIAQWDYDALEHVLIARSLIVNSAYRVDDFEGRATIRSGPHDALFKAPLYQYLLAGVFAISGFNFALFFPLQSLIGGAASGLAGLVALDLSGRRSVAAFSGLAAAGHPILVNAASQPYNENVFVALMLASIWAFLRWLATARPAWAAACGLCAGLAILCRESAVPLLAGMALFAAVRRPAGTRRSLAAAGVITGLAVAVVMPWCLRNYRRQGVVVPVSAITGSALAIGNNECLAAQPFLSWYYADGPCEPLNVKRERVFATIPEEQFLNRVVRNRVNRALAIDFVSAHPLSYARLTLQRAWTLFLPFHPRQDLGRVQRAALLVYWLGVIPAGLAGAAFFARRPPHPWLLMTMVAAMLAPEVLVYISADMRLRAPADVLLAPFAACLYVEVIRSARRLPLRASPTTAASTPGGHGGPRGASGPLDESS